MEFAQILAIARLGFGWTKHLLAGIHAAGSVESKKNGRSGQKIGGNIAKHFVIRSPRRMVNEKLSVFLSDGSREKSPGAFLCGDQLEMKYTVGDSHYVSPPHL